MKDKNNSSKNFKVFILGREIKGITEIAYTQNYTLEQLNQKLDDALKVENYELCAELKKQIDNLNKK